MKAMILKEQKPIDDHPLEAVELPRPEVGPTDLRLRVEYCGVCHTDLHTAEGDLPLQKSPVVPGHQVVGQIEALGEDVTDFQERAWVGVTWLYSACLRCDYCQRGQENLCDQAQFTGWHHDGGYAEYMVIPAAFAYPLPDMAHRHIAPLLCAGIIGYRSLRLSELQPGQRLGLYGFGASAHLTIQVARYWDCEVYVFTRSEEHQQHARELGAVWTGQAQDEPPAKLDSAITFAPVGWIVPEALRVLRKGGTLAINAVHLSNIPELAYERIYHERTVRSVANLTRQDATEFLEIAADMPIQTDVEVYPLAEANQVLQRVKRSEVRGAAVLAVTAEV